MSLFLPEKLPDSIDNAINNLTDKPTKSTGNFLADCFDLLAYSVHGVAERKRMKVDEKTERFAIERKKRIEDFKKEIFAKCKNIPNENKIDPDEQTLSILKDAEFCLKEKAIRELFANLIAKSIDSRYADNVLPAFSGIIKQFSSIDAKIFELTSSKEKQAIPVKDIYIIDDETGKSIPFMYILTSIEFYDVETVSSSINNLLRLGLFEERNIKAFDTTLYNDIDNNPKVKEFLDYTESKEIKGSVNKKIVFKEKLLTLTALGFRFHSVCCEEIN